MASRLRGWLHERWLAWRNRRLSDPSFQRWAARWRPTRRVARRDTRRLFDLCAGFVYSQILVACVELDLFAVLAERPMTTAELAERLGLPEAGCQRLLEAATSLDLVERLVDGRHALGALGAAARGNPAVGAMVSHHHALYADLADPVARLRDRGTPSALRRFWSYADVAEAQTLDAGRTSVYTRLMADSQAMIAEQLLASSDLSGIHRLLDVGGGSGRFAEAVATAWPASEVAVLDLPSVAEQARSRLAEAGQGRITCIGADMFNVAWPTGFDAVSLVRILHDHDDGAVEKLLARARAALGPGGRLIIVEPLRDTPGAEAAGAAYFGFYLWAMGQGRARSRAEIESLCVRHGFTVPRAPSVPTPLLARVLVAYRTAATDGR